MLLKEALAMKKTEKEIREILNQDIQISDVVETRIQETYRQLERGTSRRCTGSARKIAAAIAVVFLAVPGVVYASSRTEFFQAMFGNDTRESNDVLEREIDTGKKGKDAKVTVTLPSREYVPVDEAQAEKAVGDYVSDEPVVKKIGSHTLCIDSFVYDKNGAMMYFTLEREGGVTAFAGDTETNLTKGAYFTDDSDFYFNCETKNGAVACENTYIDTKKSTKEKLYCYSYILWNQPLEDGDAPELMVETYPCTRKELKETTKTETERIKLTDKDPVPVKKIDMGEKGYLEYSPIALSVDMAKGMGLSREEAADPYYLESIEISYRDKESYVVCDKEKNTENSSYQLGSGTYYKTVFNRLVDVDGIEMIKVNGVEFAVK